MGNPLSENLDQIRQKIALACKTSGREPASVTLVAVSKKQSPAAIAAALTKEQMHFGENYVQELVGKMTALPNANICWHFIGHLQRNKAKHVVGKVRLIHTVDRLSLAETIAQLALEKKVVQDCLLQIKLSHEDTKSGCPEAEVPGLVAAIAKMPSINVKGLMLIGTWTSDTELVKREFVALQGLRDHINAQGLYRTPLTELSMGMSHDYELAIEQGATIVRVGTGIFGERT